LVCWRGDFRVPLPEARLWEKARWWFVGGPWQQLQAVVIDRTSGVVTYRSPSMRSTVAPLILAELERDLAELSVSAFAARFDDGSPN
jgi:hypothetical protein